MKNNAIGLLAIHTGLFFTGCNKEPNQPNAFIEAVHAKDAEKAEAQIKSLLKPYSESNMQSFANLLEARHLVTVTQICYDCVLTIPRITDMRIEYIYEGIKESRYLDILPENQMMHLAAVHE